MRISDWSSDVCSSDLHALFFEALLQQFIPLRCHDEGAMLHRADSVTIARGLSVTRYFEKGEQAVVAHIEKIVAHAFVRRIASVVRSGPETFGHLHRMDERHADDVGIEFNRRFHVVRAQCEVMYPARRRLARSQSSHSHPISPQSS